jgi:hypothetical protein
MRLWTILLFCTMSVAASAAQRQASGPCSGERIHCFVLGETAPSSPGAVPVTFARTQLVPMNARALHGGVLAHQWVELQTSRGTVTVGYGPASIPFIDAGQISVWDQDGHIERSGLHLFPTRFNYAKPPGAGKIVGQPILLTVAGSDAVLRKETHRKLIFPYIPLFHDCHTFVCTVKATASGKSTVPCYLLFKGYW